MSKIRGRGNRDTELALVTMLRQNRLSGWRRHKAILGRPDFVFIEKRVAVFVDGCFWHGCSQHATLPVNNRSFWLNKLAANRSRDKNVSRSLRREGWDVVRIWEHELNRPDRVVRKIKRALINSSRK
jgi:DNA mismatch endonuclease (patch repair protein)